MRLAAHFYEQPTGTTENSEEGAPCCGSALLRRSVDAARGGPSTSVDGGQGFVLGAETMEGERATTGEVVARPRQEQGREAGRRPWARPGKMELLLGAMYNREREEWRHGKRLSAGKKSGRHGWEQGARPPWRRRPLRWLSGEGERRLREDVAGSGGALRRSFGDSEK